ncbi:uncharacterized protein BP5553_06607 [Venustampulla echinocandica]|uniref:DUF7730 domain-containing protein n=1 Tax=Venustampulla echinocandica TaxID=2656787 RepID=A0A370TKF4_9HELO|nr:uncharacterized protein BP5553_06607 [Venustampulla echinocandica]RDL35995.1 hypothetical protein BP5553_06607 [Venustampulla echinocandica]
MSVARVPYAGVPAATWQHKHQPSSVERRAPRRASLKPTVNGQPRGIPETTGGYTMESSTHSGFPHINIGRMFEPRPEAARPTRWRPSTTDAPKLRRSLTIPLAAATERITHDQFQTLFFRLPYEIRMVIYQMVIDAWHDCWGDKIHIVKGANLRLPVSSNLGSQDLLGVPCRIQPHDYASRRGMTSPILWPIWHDRCKIGWRDPPPPATPWNYWIGQRVTTSLSLFLTCRRIYSEAIDLLYSSFSFDLLMIAAAHHFLSAMPSQRLHHIKCLSLMVRPSLPPEINPTRGEPEGPETWQQICRIIKSMEGLQELRISIFNPCMHYRESELLHPLLGTKVQNANFVVEMSWATDKTIADTEAWGAALVEPVPFTIVRRGPSIEDHEIEPVNLSGYTRPRWRRVLSNILWCPVMAPLELLLIVLTKIVDYKESRNIRRNRDG